MKIIAMADGATRAGMRWHRYNRQVERHGGQREVLAAHFTIEDSVGGSSSSSLSMFLLQCE